MKPSVRAAALLMATLFVASLSVAQEADRKAATDAAQQWLAVVDAGHYGQSWDAAASFFQSKITKQDWEKALNQVRAPLGKMVSRQFKADAMEAKLPGAPEGKYCVIQFRTEFQHGPGPVIETITPMLDKGQWKISGYFIKASD
jgi:hypothetical protein